MRVNLIGKRESGITGMSRYTDGLHRGLKAVGVDVQLTFPRQVPLPVPFQDGLSRLGLDVRAFYASYPLRANLARADIYHLTGQMLATLLYSQRFPGPVVVTVLDIVPYLVRGVPQLNTFRHPVDYMFYKLALAGLRRADALIAISAHTKQTLVEALELPTDRIHVVYPAVDHERFRPLEVPQSFRARYGLDGGWRSVLYVGSEEPRKNLPVLVKAIARLKQRMPQVKLLKVGAPQSAEGRRELLTLVDDLGLADDVVLLNGVPDEDLPLFYSAADVCVLPSLHEGFGLPAAEAMACGTPVVVSHIGPLREVVGDAGLHVDPVDVPGLAEAILKVLGDEQERLRLCESGLRRAAMFTAERVAGETQGVYQRVIEQWDNGKPAYTGS